MLFNSFTFAIFLPIVFVLYWFVFNRNLRLQNLFVVAASYVFYGWWDWRFLLLIAFTSFCSWGFGILMQKHPVKARLFSIANILINVGLLAFFKYFNFFVASFIDAFSCIGIHLQSTTLQIILPVGISFYTFQALSYTIDVYKKKIEPTKDMVAFFAYVSFFPQLVAGPIELATNLLPQFSKQRVFDYEKAVDGMRQILWGLFKKMVVADNCAVIVNLIYNDYQNQSGSTLLLGAILFAFQIYGDFSGYSDIAIGCARLFGINLMQNFNYPYFSRDIAEFWRRWHISLTTWFRDYLYIPLGGSRTTKAKVLRNTFVIFIVSGLWHGANWTFVVWGLYNALLFVPLLLLRTNRRFTTTIVANDSFFPSVKECFQILLTFSLVVIGWIIFRSETLSDAFHYVTGICNDSLFSKPMYLWKTATKTAVISVMVMLFIEWLNRYYPYGLSRIFHTHSHIRWIAYILLAWSLYEFGGQEAEFIYFQF